MTILAIEVETHSNPFNLVHINHGFIKKLNLPINRPLYLTFGNKTAAVIIRPSSNKGNLFRIPKDVANSLLLPNGIELHASYKDRELRIGPILGILVQSIQNNQPKIPFGKFTAYAEELTQKSLSKGIVPYFFSFENINTESDYISGWWFKDSKWEKRDFPIPQVIYNRISSRSLEKKLLLAINKLKERYSFIFFNDRFLDKWEVAQMLKPTKVNVIIPKTVIYKGLKTIIEMLKEYQVIYIKPINGALGRGIFRIEKNENIYTVQYSRVQGITSSTFNSLGKLYKYLNPRLYAKPYLVQQGLELIALNNRPIDFRILVQKNDQGAWAVTSMVARIANDQSFVSNLAQGGTQEKVIETIKLVNPELAKKITKKHFKDTALLIAKQMEKPLNGHFAELGIDLALDSNGKIWLLEVNSKPSKTDDPKESNEPRPSVTRLSKYVIYLTNPNSNKNG